MSEAWILALSGAAAVGVGFLPLFLWNLWLAPYKILSERLDEVSATQTPPRAVDEEAARRSRLNMKTHDALREMERLRYCIEERERRKSDNYARPGPQDFDPDFMTLKEKYSSWFPPDLKERDMKKWAGRIISILNANDYEDAVQRIKRAVSAQSWGE